jgi:type III pantothenate kinase
VNRARILELDVGNTRAKWRLLGEDPSWCVRGVCTVPDLQGLELGDVDLLQVRVSSVRSRDFNSELGKSLLLTLGVRPQFARASAECLGVINLYTEPEKLGVDRWLAMLAAFDKVCGACLVIDAGSAITLDAIDVNGQHLGGYIVPGLAMQARSLLAGTDILAPEELRFGGLAMGCSTQAAIENGVLSMVIAWILSAMRRATNNPVLFVTGGDASVLSAALKSQGMAHECAPELVLDGLALVFPSKELG